MDGKPLKILLIEDDPDDAFLTGEALREVGKVRFVLEHADLLASGLTRLAENGADIVLLDLSLPDSDGLGTLRSVIAQAPSVPIVILTGLDDGHIAMEALQEGAQDYLVKDQFDGELLARTLCYACERKRILERLRVQSVALHRSEERLLKAQHVARMGFLDWNPKSDEMYLSEELYRLFGLNREEVPSTSQLLSQVVHPDDLEYVKENFDLAIQDAKVLDIDHRILRPEGKVIWVHAQAELVRDVNQNPEALLGTIVDITRRKIAEAELVAKNEEIKAVTQHLWHTARLATMGELAASMAHELNNPLATVSLRIEALLGQIPANDPRRRSLEVVEREVERMSTLIANLLQFSRRGAPQVSTVDVREELEKAFCSNSVAVERHKYPRWMYARSSKKHWSLSISIFNTRKSRSCVNSPTTFRWCRPVVRSCSSYS